MSISDYDALVFKRNGFLDQEIKAIAEAKTTAGNPQPPIDIGSPVWKDVLWSRYEWWQDKLSRGWSQEEIENELMNYYARDEKRNPFDFLKKAYHPPRKIAYLEVIRKRHEAIIAAELGGKYKTVYGRYRT